RGVGTALVARGRAHFADALGARAVPAAIAELSSGALLVVAGRAGGAPPHLGLAGVGVADAAEAARAAQVQVGRGLGARPGGDERLTDAQAAPQRFARVAVVATGAGGAIISHTADLAGAGALE